jgi:hypothetical protein
MKFKIIPESTIRDAMNVTPLKRIRKRLFWHTKGQELLRLLSKLD